MIGAMSPDFAFILPLGVARGSTHDLAGIFWFCLPVALAIWLLFVHVLEQPTIALLPAAWRERVPRSDARFSLKPLLLAALAIIVGAVTHIIWDAFTHGDTPVTDAIPALTAEVFEYHGRSVRVFFILQVLSSIVGLFALWIWALNLRHGAPRACVARDPAPVLTDRARVVSVLAVFLSAGAAALLSYASTAGIPIEHRVFHLLVGGMVGWLFAWCVVAMFITRSARFARRPER